MHSIQHTEQAAQRHWHATDASTAVRQLGVAPECGLTDAEARRRLAQVGPNALTHEKHEGSIEEFFEALREPMMLLLLSIGVLYFIFGQRTEAIVVWTIVLAIAGIEVFQESRATNALAALHALAEPHVPVRRDAETVQVSSSAVAPGDILLLEAGRRVAADARLLESHSLLLDESPLTGESLGVEKTADVVLLTDTPLAERRNLVFAGTTVLRGRAVGVVTATGPSTELGRIAGLTDTGKESVTPLQQALRQLAKALVWLAAALSIGIPLVGLLTGQPLRDMVLTGFALFFASVPEELPVIITMMLAVGGYRLSRQKAIVRRPRAIERVAMVSVIAADKTGTLTENRMSASEFWPEDAKSRLLQIGAMCNDAVDGKDGGYGDPLDRALVQAAESDGMDLAALRAAHALVDEYSFDDLRKRMSVTARNDGRLWVAVKGAPEAVLDVSTMEREGEDIEPLTPERRASVLDMAAQMAGAGLRVIAMAEKASTAPALTQSEAEAGLTFAGLVGMEDPLRPEAREAIASCREAGIRTIIVSGDHPLTVQAVAGQLGFPAGHKLLTGQEMEKLGEDEFHDAVRQTDVFARMTPEQKLRIVQSLTADGHSVAVTGDGINDAPALASAEVGVAMGQRGTDMARQAADIVLTDDSFGTLERAVRQGRHLFANLEKGISYYLACKVALVTSAFVPLLFKAPVPFLPVQIILMEMIMDLAASAGFLAEPEERDVMNRPPRKPHQPVLNRRVVTTLLTSGAGLAAAVIAAFLVTWYRWDDPARAHTVAFATWLVGHVLMASTLRSEQPLFRIGPMSNRVMAAWGAVVFVLLILIGTVPLAQTVTRTVGLSAQDWALVLAAAAAGTLWREVVKAVRAQPR